MKTLPKIALTTDLSYLTEDNGFDKVYFPFLTISFRVKMRPAAVCQFRSELFW